MAKRRATLERERIIAKREKEVQQIKIVLLVKKYRSNPAEMQAWINRINAKNRELGLI